MKKIVFSAFAIIIAGGFIFLKDAGRSDKNLPSKKHKPETKPASQQGSEVIEAEKDSLERAQVAFQ